MKTTLLEYITTKKAKEISQVTVETLRVWDKEGKVRTIRTKSNIRRYNLKDIQNIVICGSNSEAKEKICYCRVSSRKQMDDLERQKDFFRDRFPNHKLVTDVGSGINWKRKGLRTILDKTMHGDISEIVVAHRDRFTRFGFELFEWIFQKHAAQLLCHREEPRSDAQELSEDLLALVTVFSARYHGKRKYRKKQDVHAENQDLPDPGTETGFL